MKYLEYKPQGNSNPINITIVILIGSVIAFFLGWLYSFMTLIPIIYFKFLITVGFGYTLSFSIIYLSKLFYIKDRKSRLLIIGIVLIVAYYSHWISFIVQTYNDGFPTLINYTKYWIKPNEFFYAIGEINKYGTWGINFSGLINGMYLTLIWIVEASIIFVIALAHIYRFPENPFSEKLNKWYPKIVLNEEFEPIYSSSKFVLKFKEKGIETIFSFAKGFSQKYAKISIFYLEGEDVQYLSIDNIFIDLKNNSKTKITPKIKPIQISTKDAKKLIEKFDITKEFYLDF